MQTANERPKFQYGEYHLESVSLAKSHHRSSGLCIKRERSSKRGVVPGQKDILGLKMFLRLLNEIFASHTFFRDRLMTSLSFPNVNLTRCSFRVFSS